jgi:hypothetical protein
MDSVESWAILVDRWSFMTAPCGSKDHYLIFILIIKRPRGNYTICHVSLFVQIYLFFIQFLLVTFNIYILTHCQMAITSALWAQSLVNIVTVITCWCPNGQSLLLLALARIMLSSTFSPFLPFSTY